MQQLFKENTKSSRIFSSTLALEDKYLGSKKMFSQKKLISSSPSALNLFWEHFKTS